MTKRIPCGVCPKCGRKGMGREKDVYSPTLRTIVVIRECRYCRHLIRHRVTETGALEKMQ